MGNTTKKYKGTELKNKAVAWRDAGLMLRFSKLASKSNRRDLLNEQRAYVNLIEFDALAIVEGG